MSYEGLIAQYDNDAPEAWKTCVEEVKVIADLAVAELSDFDVTLHSGSFPQPESKESVLSAVVTLRVFVPCEEGEELHDDAGSLYVDVMSVVPVYEGGSVFFEVRVRPFGRHDLGVEAKFSGSLSARGVMRTVRRLVGLLDDVVEEAN